MPRPPGSPRLSFPKRKRLMRPVEFGRVKSEGKTYRGRFLMLGVFVPEDEKQFRAGFVTSKYIGGAVVRNRVRRRLRDIVRTQQTLLRPGLWLVLVARPAASRANYLELKEEWLRLAQEASIFREPIPLS